MKPRQRQTHSCSPYLDSRPLVYPEQTLLIRHSLSRLATPRLPHKKYIWCPTMGPKTLEHLQSMELRKYEDTHASCILKNYVEVLMPHTQTHPTLVHLSLSQCDQRPQPSFLGSTPGPSNPPGAHSPRKYYFLYLPTPLGLCLSHLLWPEVPPSSSHSVLGLGKTSPGLIRVPVSPSTWAVCVAMAAPTTAGLRTELLNRHELLGQQA